MKVKLILFIILFSNVAMAQIRYTITGHLPEAAGKQIVLNSFTFSGDVPITTTNTDKTGKFSLEYPADYVGAAILEIANAKSLIVLLNHENFEIYWDKLQSMETLRYVGSPENNAFSQGLEIYQKSEAKRAGLSYLIPYYDDEPKEQIFIKKELEKQDKVLSDFLTALPQDSYAIYYIQLRRLLQDMPQTASRYGERMPEHEKKFNAMDFSNEKLIHSGLYKQLLESYFTLLESSIDDKYAHMNASIDALIQSLKSKPELLQEVSQNLFNLLEKRSLFPAAEHLAIAMLSDDACQLDDKHIALFEQYRKMANGNTAADIIFPVPVKGKSKLSEITSKYKLVVFGASWCPKCSQEIPKLKTYYEKWKDKGLEIVFISLDTDQSEYNSFVSGFPWISSCDYKSWQGKAVVDYCVFATPTMYLLDKDQKIMVKPISAEQIETWLIMMQ